MYHCGWYLLKVEDISKGYPVAVGVLGEGIQWNMVRLVLLYITLP